MNALATQLAEGVQALRDGDAVRATELLAPVAEDSDLAAAHDLADVRARVQTLYAQALLQAGQASRARHPLATARELLTELGDEAGLAAVAELEQQIGEAISAAFAARGRARSIRAETDRELEDRLDSVPPSARPALLVERATARLDAGDASGARPLASRALDLATQASDVRHQVLAGLILARASTDPEEARDYLQQAHRRADLADEFNLVGFVAKAASEAGIPLNTLIGDP